MLQVPTDVKLHNADDRSRLLASQLLITSLLWLLSTITKYRTPCLVDTPRCSYVKGSLNQVCACCIFIVFTIYIIFYPLSKFLLSDKCTLLTLDWLFLTSTDWLFPLSTDWFTSESKRRSHTSHLKYGFSTPT